MTQKMEDTQHVVTYKIPSIEVYQVTDDELMRIEETAGQAGQDFAFMLASLSIFISFVIALATADFGKNTQLIFIVVAAISVSFGIRTGWIWFRNKSNFQKVIEKIRSRKVDPEV